MKTSSFSTEQENTKSEQTEQLLTCSGLFSCAALTAQTRVSCYLKWGSSPMQECCSCLAPFSSPLLLPSNRFLHHLLGLFLTPSVMVHFTLLINNAQSPFHTFIFLPAYKLLTALLPPSHIRPFNSN